MNPQQQTPVPAPETPDKASAPSGPKSHPLAGFLALLTKAGASLSAYVKEHRKTGVVAIAFAAVIPVLAFYAYYLISMREQTYYDKLEKDCSVSEGYSCCIASVREMEEKGYVLSTRGACSSDERVNRLKCIGSFEWCEPVPHEQAEKLKRGEPAAFSGTVIENVPKAGSSGRESYILVQTEGGSRFPVYYRLDNCKNPQAESGMFLNGGLSVEVRGTAISESDVSICGSDADYVRLAVPDDQNWTAYRNDEYGLEFKKPVSWNARIADGRVWVGPASPRMHLGESGGVSLSMSKRLIETAAIVNELSRNPKQTLATKRVEWNGQSVLRFKWRDAIGVTEDVILAEYGEFTYALMFDERDPVHQAILSTVRFYESDIKSGIEGVVMIGPTCPVERPDLDCADKPYPADLRIADSEGNEKSVASGYDGRFRVLLAPGTYTIRSASQNALPYLSPVSVTVEEGLFAPVRLMFDSGIR